MVVLSTGVIVALISCIVVLPLSVIGVVILCWLKKRKKSPNSDTLPHSKFVSSRGMINNNIIIAKT